MGKRMYARDMYRFIWKDLIRDKAMIFLSGPRQSGKTALAQMIAKTYTECNIITKLSL